MTDSHTLGLHVNFYDELQKYFFFSVLPPLCTNGVFVFKQISECQHLQVLQIIAIIQSECMISTGGITINNIHHRNLISKGILHQDYYVHITYKRQNLYYHS